MPKGEKMKRLVLLAVFVLLSSLLTVASDLEKGQLLLSTQAGVTSRSGSAYQFKLESPVSRSFTLGVSYEQRRYASSASLLLNPEFILDGGYAENTYLLARNSPFVNSQSFFLEGAYHFTFIPLKRLDAFAGLGIGLDIEGGRSVWKPEAAGQGGITYKSANSYDLAEKLFTGFNYFFTEKIGLGGRFTLHHNPWTGTVPSAMVGATFKLK
jgi:hypothetical protein